MTITITSIVEGDGEVSAVPALIRRFGQNLAPDLYVNAPPGSGPAPRLRLPGVSLRSTPG
jgi:hypothetical protein